MPTPGPAHRTVRRAALALSLATLSCGGGDPQGPNPDPDPASYLPVAVGDTVSAELPGTADEASFTFRVTEAGRLALFAIADGTITLTVTDSATDRTTPGLAPLAVVAPAGPAGATLLERRSDRFEVQPGRTYAIRARHVLFDTATARFRMFLYRIDPAPEHRPAAIALGDTVTGEGLENSADVDEFTVTAPAGAELIGYVQGDDPIHPAEAVMIVRAADGTALATAGSDTGSTDLESWTTGRFLVPAAGTYRVALQGGLLYAPEQAPRGYRFELAAVSRAPEAGPAAVVVGDTVTGSIEHVGDVDEFTLSGAPGQAYNFFFQALTDTAHVLHAVVEPGGPPGNVLASLESSGRDTSLYAEAAGTSVLPASGSATVRIEGRSDRRGLDRGSFRFYAYPINRAPETGPATIALGDSLGGVIDLPGDVDEFVFTVPATRLISLVWTSPTGGGPLGATLLDATGTTVAALGIEAGPATGHPALATTNAIQVSQGSYRLQVEGGSQSGAFVGPYRIATHPINAAPEGVPGTVAYDVPVIGEAITPIGDFDRYGFTGAKGDVLTAWFQPGSGPVGGPADAGLGLSVFPAAGGGLVSVGQRFGHDSIETGRFILPADGAYLVAVSGDNSPPGNEGAYRFTLHRLDTQPEHVPAAIAPGAVVTAEQLDRAGDVDEFVLSAAAGSEQQVTVQGMANVALKLEVDVPVTYDSLKGTDSFGFLQATGRFPMPAGGQARIRIYQRGIGGLATGPYSFSVIPVVRAPESVAAALTRGVVVRGESIGYPGDVDEFTFPASAGETITAFLQTPAGFPGSGDALLEVLEPGTGTVLGSATSHNPAPGPFGVSTGPITLTASGTYRLRVQSTDDRDGTGAIEVMVQ